MRQLFSLLVFFFSLISVAFAQNRLPVQRCGTPANSSFQNTQPNQAHLQSFAQFDGIESATGWSRNQDSIITIPVVVHVLYRNETQNISEAQIQSQIDVINRDFQRMNADTVNTPAEFDSLAANCNIRFCRASLDPDSNFTTGITRTETSVFNIGNTSFYFVDSLGGKTIWDPSKYLNIWVCELGGLLGFSSQPGSSVASDGVVIGYQNFGTFGTVLPPYHKGRTTTHEIGHWLGLMHVSGDDSGTCTGSDLIDDTPNQAGDYSGCPTHPQSSCSSNDMFMNFMDLADDSCMNLFTFGQRARMRFILNNMRSELDTSHACDSLEWPSLVAGFVGAPREINVGESVDFISQSNGDVISWQWFFEGGNPATTFQVNPSNVDFAVAGYYDVSLVVSDGALWDTLTLENYIRVKEIQPCDTLLHPFPGSAVTYFSPNGGYVAGNNGYHDRAKANFFDNYGPYAYLNGAQIWFSASHNGSANPNARIKVWAANGPNGKPGDELQTTLVDFNTIAQAVDDSLPVTVLFDEPLIITGDFYIGFLLDPTHQDSLAVFTNTDGDHPTGIAWELWNDSTWHTYVESWAIRVANAIQPIICGPIPTGIAPQSQPNFSVYPNPTSGQVTISWGTEKPLKIRVTDLTGKTLLTKTPSLSRNSQQFALDNFPAGMYFISIRFSTGIATRRLVISD